jgi:hypothetical protein
MTATSDEGPFRERCRGWELIVVVPASGFPVTHHLSQLKEDGLGSNVLPRTSFCSWLYKE